MSDPIGLVCLDLGGVMMRICRGWGQACRAARLSLPAHLPDDRDVARRIWPFVHAHESGAMDEHRFDALVSAEVGVSAADIAAVSNAWLQGPYPGANDLVRKLARVPGLRTACLSNTNRRHWRAMTSPGPFELALQEFTWRFASFEIGHMKPDAAIYAHVESVVAADGIAPASILFFDDHPANITAARERGWQVEQIDPENDPPQQISEHLSHHGVRVTR